MNLQCSKSAENLFSALMPNLIGKSAGGAVQRLCSGGEHTRTLKEQLSPVVHCGDIRLLRHVTVAMLSPAQTSLRRRLLPDASTTVPRRVPLKMKNRKRYICARDF